MVKPEQIEKIKQFIKNNNCLCFEIIDPKNKQAIFDFACDNPDEIASEIDDYLTLFADGLSIDVVVHANAKTKTKGKTFLIRNQISAIPASVNTGNAELLVKYALLEQSIKHEQMLREKDSIIAGFNDPDDEDEDEIIAWHDHEAILPYKEKFFQNPMGTIQELIAGAVAVVHAFNPNNQTIVTGQAVAGVDEDKLIEEYLKIDPDAILIIKAMINLAKTNPTDYAIYKPLLLKSNAKK
jgi:hypothetical protein